MQAGHALVPNRALHLLQGQQERSMPAPFWQSRSSASCRDRKIGPLLALVVQILQAPPSP